MRTTLGFWRFDLVGYTLVGLVALGLLLLSPRLLSTAAVSLPVAQSAFASETQGLLSQTAQHLSKMRGGASVGGFPGFEPLGDDDKYREKIKQERYSAQDVNDWVREINNFLNQIIQKNPGLTLREILQREGLTSTQIDNFIDALQRVEYVARGMQGAGVRQITVQTLQQIMQVLEVPLWPY